jgi:Na+/alanine symporter
VKREHKVAALNSLLKVTQKYAIVVVLIIIVALIAATSDPDTVQDDINAKFGSVVGVMAAVVFSSLPDALSAIWAFLTQVPLVILVLLSGSVFFTLRFNFINFIGFRHAIEVTMGKYDDPEDPGEVSHFQALSSALSATVGLGNIAGVAMAVSVGGPGAIFWMMVTATFGMTAKFAECALGQMYRRTDARGNVQGGPMVYLRDGLAELGYPGLGRYLSIIFALLCIGGSFGGGNMFQANQSFEGMVQVIPWLGGEHASGQVALTASAPREIVTKKHLVRFVRPGVAGEAPRDKNLYFVPTADVMIKEADWQLGPQGLYTTTLPVAAMRASSAHNLGAGEVTVIELAGQQGRALKWAPAADITATNPAALEGGTMPRGWLFGIILALMVGVVIIGGIQSIGKVAEKIVPIMCGTYVLTGLAIVAIHYSEVPAAVGVIFSEAFTPQAGVGGLIGAFIQGVKRAAFSSEAGVGSAAIAHSAAKTSEPVREGIVALLEPFIDTIVVCFTTGIVIVITGVYSDPATAGLDGVQLTSAAFGSVFSWFPFVLSVSVFLFAYSTMISWSYYGERCWTFLFGTGQSMSYRAIFLCFVWLGCVSNLSNVTDFSDLMILAMAFPNILGVVLLSGKLRDALESYWSRYKAGEFPVYTKK